MPPYTGLVFSETFLRSLHAGRFSRSELDQLFRALQRLDENERHPSLRVHQLRGDSARAVAELGRVTRPNGRVAVTEPDWETAVVDAPDEDAEVSRRIAAACCARFRSRRVGRRLPRLLHGAGLDVVTVVPHTAVLRRLAEADPVCLLRASAAHATAQGLISPVEAAAWVVALEAADRAGHFLATVTLFSAVGRTA